MKPLNGKLQKEFVRLRIKMNDNHPFFAQLSMYLKPWATDSIPTMGVDIKGNLYINEEFFAKTLTNPRDAFFCLAHEIMHLATDTARRAPPVLERSLWNQASDTAINQIIVDSGISLPHPDVIKPLHKSHYNELAKYDDMSTEQIYFDMIREAQKNGKGITAPCPNCGNSHSSTGGSGDGKYKGAWWDDSAERINKGDGKGEESNGKTKEEMEAEWRDRIASAASAAKSAGKLPGALGVFCGDLLKPKKNWRRELSRYMSTFLRGNWTWRRISRRTSGIIRTPGRDPMPPQAVLYMDTSGSVSDKELQRALSEIKAIIQLNGGKGRLLLGDAEIYYDGEITADALDKIPVQRGGTDFNCVFETIGNSKPDVLVMFTDLYGPHPATPPGYPVIWCCYEGNHAPHPWGNLIEIEVDWR